MAERTFAPAESPLAYPQGIINDALNPLNAPDTYEKIKRLPQTIPAELRNAKQTFTRGSTAHYPALGVAYTLAHPSLWGTILCSFCCSFIFSVVWTVAMFAGVMPPLARAIEAAGCPAWAAWIVAVILAFLFTFLGFVICTMVFMGQFEMALFDKVLKLEGFGDLVRAKKGWLFFTPSFAISILFNLSRLFGLLVALPLNIVPILGTVLYAYLNSGQYATERHVHYLVDIKHLSFGDAWSYTFHPDRRAEYSQFGFTAMSLEMIPVLQSIFVLTNTVGAALWACDIERGKMAGPDQTDFREAKGGDRDQGEGGAVAGTGMAAGVPSSSTTPLSPLTAASSSASTLPSGALVIDPPARTVLSVGPGGTPPPTPRSNSTTQSWGQVVPMVVEAPARTVFSVGGAGSP